MLVRPVHQMHPGEQQKQTGVGYGRQLFVSQHRDTGRERERAGDKLFSFGYDGL